MILSYEPVTFGVIALLRWHAWFEAILFRSRRKENREAFLAEEIDKFYTMSAIMRGLIMRAPVASQLAVQRATIVSGPPRVRMSFAVRNLLKLYDDNASYCNANVR